MLVVTGTGLACVKLSETGTARESVGSRESASGLSDRLDSESGGGTGRVLVGASCCTSSPPYAD